MCLMQDNQQKPLVVFGASRFASLTAYGLTKDARRTVASFTVNAPFVRSGTLDGYPVTAFESLVEAFPPNEHEIILPLGFTNMNRCREERCKEAKAMGYHVANYISKRANVWEDFQVGENVIIFEGAIVQGFATLGDNVMVRSGANIGHHSQIGSHSFIASGAVTGGNVAIGDHCWIGLGAVLRDNISIAERCFIGAGAVVIADTEPDGVYVGNPARRMPGKTSLDITG